MHPFEYYETLRLGREELLRQAEQERLARHTLIKRSWRRFFHAGPSGKLSLKQE